MNLDEHNELITNMEGLIPRLKKTYYETDFEGMVAFDLLDRSQKHQINVKLQGPTGAGKTITYEAFCQQTSQPHFVSNMKGSTTSEELIGAFVPNDSSEGGNYIWKNGIIVRALLYSNVWVPVEVEEYVDDKGVTQYKWDKPKPNYEIDPLDENDYIESLAVGRHKMKAWPRCMLTVEEINFSPEELMSVWFSLLDLRRNIVLNEKNGEIIHAGKFLSVNATMNPHYIGTNELNDALNDRFLIKLNVDYDNKVENKIINEKVDKYNFNLNDVRFIKKFVKHIRKSNSEGQCGNISTRMIEAYLENKGLFGEKIALVSMFNSFDDQDIGLVKNIYELVIADTNTIDLTDQEMEGLDLDKFEEYKPPKLKSVKAVRGGKQKGVPAPFMK
jgi:MoxR-like ATPase